MYLILFLDNRQEQSPLYFVKYSENIFEQEGCEPIPDDGLTLIPDIVQSPIPDSGQTVEEPETFVPITSLLADENYDITEYAAAFIKVSIGQYTGVYEKVQSVKSAVLSENRGNSVSGTEEWYYVSGHKDMQYLIRLVYQINSADAISEITVRSAKMDNTDEGKAIQASYCCDIKFGK